MKMKKLASLIMAAAIAASLAGCGNSGSTSSAGSPAQTPSGSSAQASTSSTTNLDWPKQPVNIMVPAAAAGGGTDIMVRLVNEYFTKLTGQTFVITNQTGIAGYEQTHQANTDGYNFIDGTTTILTSKEDGTLSYDWSDYAMVAFIEGNYNTVIAVEADSPYQTINDLLDAAKAPDSKVTGGVTMSGQPYLFAKALAAKTGIDLYYVDVGNTSERNAALLGGQVDYIITNTTAAQAYVDSGDFRFIAIDGNERYELAPDVPTFKEQGVDFCFVSQPTIWLAPKGTSEDTCEAMNAILAKIWADPNFKEDMRGLNAIVYAMPSVSESTTIAQQYAEELAPYIK